MSLINAIGEVQGSTVMMKLDIDVNKVLVVTRVSVVFIAKICPIGIKALYPRLLKQIDQVIPC